MYKYIHTPLRLCSPVQEEAPLRLAVNGVPEPSTAVSVLVATGNTCGTAMITLAGGDVLTMRNNSATPLTMTLAPSIGAQVSIVAVESSSS